LATPHAVADPDDPRLAPYRSIRERDLAGRHGLFVVEGEVVLRLMLARGRYGLASVLLSARRAAGSPDLVASIPDDVPLYVAGDAVIEAVAGFHVHRGVLGIGLRGEPENARALVAALPAHALVVVGVGLANHDNMGGLLRNAAAFGADAALFDATCCDPLYRKAIRVSVGAALTVPFARGGTGAAIVDILDSAGIERFALSPAGAADLMEASPPRRAALVFGAEGPGLDDALMRRMRTLRIGMAEGLDSLNVATASGIALHRFFGHKQRISESP